MINNNYEKESFAYRIKAMSYEYGIDLNDLLSIAEIYCKNLDQLREEGFSRGCRYVAKMINKNKWGIIDNKNISIIEYSEDELTAYRLARAYSILRNTQKISSFNNKLYEIKNNNINI